MPICSPSTYLNISSHIIINIKVSVVDLATPVTGGNRKCLLQQHQSPSCVQKTHVQWRRQMRLEQLLYFVRYATEGEQLAFLFYGSRKQTTGWEDSTHSTTTLLCHAQCVHASFPVNPLCMCMHFESCTGKANSVTITTTVCRKTITECKDIEGYCSYNAFLKQY